MTGFKSKYRVDPDDRIEVEIWIDTGKDGDQVKVLPSYCYFTQGTSPCLGDVLKPCHSSYKLCNHHTKDLCTDELGKLQFMAKSKNQELPKNIVREWAKFGRETWGIKSYIETNSIRVNPANQQREYDAHRQQQLMIMCLLREWSLGKYDPELEIRHCVQDTLPFTMMQKEQFDKISQVSGDIMKAFIDGYLRKTRELL